MDRKRFIQLSKYLSKHLRHQPDKLGLKVRPGGWVEIAELLDACRQDGVFLTREQLKEIVERNDKQRFAIDESGESIRANQGHSIDIDLQLEPVIPPDVLYHGTPDKNIDSIMTNGLSKMQRHHVHLADEEHIETTLAVGGRRGKPVLFAIDARSMHEDGFTFYCTSNRVWLVDHVPPRYLKLSDHK